MSSTTAYPTLSPFLKTVHALSSTGATRVDDTLFSIHSDIAYTTDADQYLKLSFGKVVGIPFTLSSSVSGNTPVTYFLDGTQPSWVYVDSSTGLVTADTSQATIGSNYVFGVLTAPTPSTWAHSQQQVTISVVG